MAMVQMTGALPGGLPNTIATGGMPTSGMMNGVPPSPGVNNNFAGGSPAQMQQKMLRQRQLALERRRLAGRHASGGMAQANQLPVDNLYSKAPGWDRVLGEGIEKPGSLAEKAEQAFSAKKGPTVVKTINSLPSVDEKTEEIDQPAAVSSRSTNDLQAKPKRVSTRSNGNGVEGSDEIEVCDIIDSVFLEPPKMDSQQRGAAPQIDSSPGWNLHVEHQPSAPQPAADVTVTAVSAVASHKTEDSGRRWYKPWQRAPKPAPAPAPAPVVEKKPSIEETAVSAFSVDRHSISTPDSVTDLNTGASSMAWGGGAGGARARRRRPSPESEDTDLQFMGEMMAPGAIEERLRSPAQRPKATPVQANTPQVTQTTVTHTVPHTTTSVQPFSNENMRPESKMTESSSKTSFARPKRDEGSDVQAFRPDLDEMSDVGDRPARPDRQRPSREPGWNNPVDGGGEQMVRKRFWKPFGNSKPPPPSGNSAGSVETTMVCAFDG
mmetsp:Transcript_136627/g.237540  ORF Transcript_136627/g.237540 Transcript_136627/m.237540 type:complete len:492 (-) Transcript_136627:146-1621(-)